MSDPDHIYVDRGMCGRRVNPAEAGGAVRYVGALQCASGSQSFPAIVHCNLYGSEADVVSVERPSESIYQCDDQLGGLQYLHRCSNFDGWQSSAPVTGHTVSKPSRAFYSECQRGEISDDFPHVAGGPGFDKCMLSMAVAADCADSNSGRWKMRN